MDNDVKVRDNCHINGKDKLWDCNVNFKLNHKLLIVFYNLKKYYSYLIMQELGTFNLEITVIPNGLEKYMSYIINNKLSFIDSVQFLSFSLDSLVKNLSKNNFKYLIQEFDSNVVDLVKQKLFYPYQYMSDFENFYWRIC